MTFDQWIHWFAVATGYAGGIAFIVLAFKWTSTIRQCVVLLNDAHVQHPGTLRWRQRVTDSLKHSRRSRRQCILLAVALFIYGTWILTMAVKL